MPLNTYGVGNSVVRCEEELSTYMPELALSICAMMGDEMYLADIIKEDLIWGADAGMSELAKYMRVWRLFAKGKRVVEADGWLLRMVMPKQTKRYQKTKKVVRERGALTEATARVSASGADEPKPAAGVQGPAPPGGYGPAPPWLLAPGYPSYALPPAGPDPALAAELAKLKEDVAKLYAIVGHTPQEGVGKRFFDLGKEINRVTIRLDANNFPYADGQTPQGRIAAEQSAPDADDETT